MCEPLARAVGVRRGGERLPRPAGRHASRRRTASDRVTVDLEAAGNALRIGVRDDSDHRPRLRTTADDDTEGRGLTIVEALARRWWVEEHENGKTVWAELPLARPAG
jgi:hypothetical protein